jgi:hypothetical protein
MATVALAGTLDTKGKEFAFLAARVHSTTNTGWRTLRLIVTYTPGSEEQALTALPDFARHQAGEVVRWQRSGP